MKTKVIHILCPEYQFQDLNLEDVSNCIDKVIRDNFINKSVVIRGIQSEKHNLPKDSLIDTILKTGTDRIEKESVFGQKVNDIDIDLFGYGCVVEQKNPITVSILEGFHKWKPKCLEKPQRRIDIWMIYNANKLENIEYTHKQYNVKVRDGYIFKDSFNKHEALIGLIVID